MMSATPIPRTLALVLHGTMVVSCIKELPPGRLPIRTKVVDETDSVAVQRMYADTNGELDSGGRVYIVYPLIEESTSERMATVKAAEDEFRRLKVGAGGCVSLESSKVRTKYNGALSWRPRHVAPTPEPWCRRSSGVTDCITQ